MEIRIYQDSEGRAPFQRWLQAVQDRAARAKIRARLARVEAGNFGDCKPLRDGVWELRVDVGAGYRVCYAHVGDRVILLIGGGDKKSQSRDIERSVKLLKDWEQRNG